MWIRGELKDRAKGVLKLSYWKAFGISLIILIAGGSHSSRNGFNYKRNSYDHDSINVMLDPNIGPDIDILPFNTIVLILLFLSIVCLRIFLGYPLEVGGRKYFVRSTQREFKFNYIVSVFNNGHYLNVIKTMFTKGVYIFLWTLLLIVPGIVKTYAYRMVPYILSDNPSLDSDRVLELSIKMTDNQKWDIWVLDLSFIGWYLIGSVLLGLGVFFVHPYMDATNAELYLELREKALLTGACTYDELNLSEPVYSSGISLDKE